MNTFDTERDPINHLSCVKSELERLIAVNKRGWLVPDYSDYYEDHETRMRDLREKKRLIEALVF